MATKRYVGKQVQRADRYSLTVTAVAAGGTIGLTINSKTVQYLCVSADTTATAAANLVAAIAASEDAEFRDLTAAVDATTTNQINVTTTDPGVFITADGATALSVASSGGSTITSAVVEAGKSPADGGDTVNWSGGALPLAGDDWWFEDAPSPMSLHLTPLAGLAVATLTVLDSFTGAGIGLPKFNRAGGYEEFRAGRLALLSCGTLTVRLPAGALPESFRFDVGTAGGCAVKVFGAGETAVGAEEVDWVGTGAGNTVEVIGGGLKVAHYIGDAATVSTAKCVNGALTLGKGCTVTDVVNEGGAVDLWCTAGMSSLNQRGGSAQAFVRAGAGAITTLTIDGGTVYHSGTGTITTLTVGPDCTIDFSGLDEGVTITNLVLLHKGATFWDPNGRVTMTAGYKTVDCTDADVTVNFGVNRTHVVS